MRISETARRGLARYRLRADLMRRRIPDIRVNPASGSPMVYYLVPPSTQPHGGIRVAHRHVEVLNDMGVPAAILDLQAHAHPNWFESSAPSMSLRELAFKKNDILVVPEYFGPSMSVLDPEIRVLVFNQGAYITFDSLDYERSPAGAPYRQIQRLEGIMTVSRDSADLLRLTFPNTPIDVARPVVDSKVFHPGTRRKREAFAFVTTRRAGELNQVLHTLRARGNSWEPLPLRGLTELQLAEALRDSAVFLSLSDRDGFGLPPAEAMACGCYVVGYAGGGGREFFDSDYCRPVDSTIDLIRELERAMQTPLAELRAAGERAADAILASYDEQGLRSDLERIYSRLI